MTDLVLMVGGPLLAALGVYLFRRVGHRTPPPDLVDIVRKHAQVSRQVRYQERKRERGVQLELDLRQPPTDLDDLLDEAEDLHRKNRGAGSK